MDALMLISGALCLSLQLCVSVTSVTPFVHRIDHQFRAPGDVQFGVFDSRFNDPELLKSFHYTAQAGRYAETALTFDALRPSDPFFPVGSPERAWIDGHGDAIRAEQNATAEAGLKVMSHIDFPILPRKVIEAYGDKICLNGTAQRCEASFGEGSQLLAILDVMMDEMFEAFPLLDGIIIRTGEHYIIDLPYHQAVGIRASGPGPILTWFRDTVAEKKGKLVVWRTWDVHPDEAHANPASYLALTASVEPHPNLFFSMKHSGWDYWRYVRFNPTIGIGSHGQIVEASCQRSYEGKGIWPSYVARGIIEGFPEQAINTNYTGGMKGLRDVLNASTIKGLWTWSRGDGNYGPYTKAGELWQMINCRVLTAWSNDPSQDEADIFLKTVGSDLSLSPDDTVSLRRIAVASERAVLLGRYVGPYDRVMVPFPPGDHQHSDFVTPSATWFRDYATDGSAIVHVMTWLVEHNEQAEALQEKADAVALFEQMQTEVQSMAFEQYQSAARLSLPDPQLPPRLRSSIEVGLRFFRAVQAAWDIAALGVAGDKAGVYNRSGITEAALRYNASWASYTGYLLSCPTCGTPMFDRFCESPARVPDPSALPGTPACSDGMTAMVQHYAQMALVRRANGEILG